MLEADGLHVGYGDAPALWDVSLTVGRGELVAVVGPNGAGKTTLVNAIARLLPIRRGRLRLDDNDVTHVSAQAVCEAGVALIPEGRRLFAGMSVEENLEMGAYRADARRRRADGLERVYAMFPILRERRRQLAGSLSGGEVFLTSLALALALSSKIQLRGRYPLGFFFLDEGFGSLDAEKLDKVMSALEKLHDRDRMVGVISHVREMKERLPRYLEVVAAGEDGAGSQIRF